MGETVARRQKLNIRQWGILIACCAMFFFAPTFGSIAPTFSLYPEAFGISPATVSWLMSVASPLQIVAGLFVGTLVGNKIPFRVCAVAATAIFTLFGGLPFIWQDIPWSMLLLSRFIFGLGCGCFNPLVQSVITYLFRDETARAAWIGVINVVFNLGATLSSLVCGALSMNGSWQNAYAFYLFCAIPLILSIIFFRDRDILSVKDEDESKAKEELKQKLQRKKGDLPALVIAFACVFALSTIVTGGFRDYVTISMGQIGFNTLTISSVFTMISVASLVAAAGNAIFWKALRVWNFPLAFALLFIGYLCCMVGYREGSITLFFAAAIIMGIGRALIAATMPMIISITVAPAALTLAMGIQEVARTTGSFLSAPWLNLMARLFGDTAEVQITGILALASLGFLTAIILAARTSKRLKENERKSED